MYDSGVLGVEDVLRSYMDIGYDLEKATKMTEFTVALSNAAERDLTKTDIINGLKIGYFGDEEARANLKELGYSDEEADYYVSKVYYDLWQKEIKEVVKYLQQQFVVGLISENDVYAELGRLNLPADQINRYIREWTIKLDAKTKTLTASKLSEFFLMGIITPEEFYAEMSGLGYNDRYIEWYLLSFGMEEE